MGVIATDTGSRVVGAGSLGAPDVGNGGANYTLGGTFANMSVDGTRLLFNHTVANGALTGYLLAVSARDVTALATFRSDKLAVGDKIDWMLFGRVIDNANYIRCDIALATDQTLDVTAYEVIANVSNAISDPVKGAIVQIPRETHAAATDYNFEVTWVGANPTRVQARFWRAGTARPIVPDAEFRSSTAAFQVAGGVGVRSFLRSLASNAPVQTGVDSIFWTDAAVGSLHRDRLLMMRR